LAFAAFALRWRRRMALRWCRRLCLVFIVPPPELAFDDEELEFCAKTEPAPKASVSTSAVASPSFFMVFKGSPYKSDSS
jgi:hypothetical protein